MYAMKLPLMASEWGMESKKEKEKKEISQKQKEMPPLVHT